MAVADAKRVAANKKRRAWLERICMAAVAVLLIFSATSAGQEFWNRLFLLSGFAALWKPPRWKSM